MHTYLKYVLIERIKRIKKFFSVLNDFILMLKTEKGLAKNSVDAYKRDIQEFLDYFQSCPIQSINTDDVTNYFCILREKHGDRTVARKLSALKQFYLFLLRANFIKCNIVESITAPKISKPLPKILTKEEVDHLLHAASLEKSKALYTMLEILYATGMRISELTTLKKTSISYYENHPIILIKGKGGKERLVPLNEKAYSCLQSYQKIPNKTVWLFPSYGKMGHITRQRFGQLLKKVALKANIDPDKVSPHIIRHAFATHMLQNGADLVLIKELLGHNNLSTSEIYLHVLPEDLKRLVEEHHPLSSSTDDFSDCESEEVSSFDC